MGQNGHNECILWEYSIAGWWTPRVQFRSLDTSTIMSFLCSLDGCAVPVVMQYYHAIIWGSRRALLDDECCQEIKSFIRSSCLSFQFINSRGASVVRQKFLPLEFKKRQHLRKLFIGATQLAVLFARARKRANHRLCCPGGTGHQMCRKRHEALATTCCQVQK